MAFNANFQFVELTDDGALTITGRSKPADGATAITVALIQDGAMRSAGVAHPLADPWTAEFAPGPTPFALEDSVIVCGVAAVPGHDPVFWTQPFTIRAQGDVR